MKNKRIDDISKICQNVMVFLPKTMVSIFQMQEKLEMDWKLNLINSRRPSFRDHVNGTFTS